MTDGFDQLDDAVSTLDDNVAVSTLDDDYRMLAQLRKDDLRLSKEAEAAHSAYLTKRTAVYERMEEEGVGSTRLIGIGNFIRNEPTWRPVVQDKRALLAYAKDNLPALVEVGLSKRLLNQIVAERMRDGVELPPGLGAYPDKVVSIRKA